MKKFILVLLIAIVASEAVTVIARPDFKEFKEKLLNALNWEELYQLILTYWFKYVANLIMEQFGDLGKALVNQLYMWYIEEEQRKLLNNL